MTAPPVDLGVDGAEAVEAPHEISLLVWNAPAPARTGSQASVTVGARCSQGCSLAGGAVEVRDADGAAAGRAVLGPDPLPAAEALYAAEVTFPAPGVTGLARMTATCTLADLPTAHPPACVEFGFRVDPPADHEVRVRVVFETAPLAGAEVWIGHYASETDAAGEATFHVPKGTYDCSVRKLGYQADPLKVEVALDLSIEISAGKGETREELEARLSAWESYPWS